MEEGGEEGSTGKEDKSHHNQQQGHEDEVEPRHVGYCVLNWWSMESRRQNLFRLTGQEVTDGWKLYF